MRYIYFLFLSLFFIFSSRAETYPEVVFDNSLIPDMYAKSVVYSENGSWVENVNKHLPVSDSIFFTPGNALSLKYQSLKGGNWKATVRYSRQKFHYRPVHSDVLTLKMYVSSAHTKIPQLPLLSLQYKNGESQRINLASFIDDYNTNTWLDIRIPVAKIKGINLQHAIEGISFLQNGEGSHHIFVDQIEFLPGSYSKVRLTSPALLSKVNSYDKHIHLQWQLPLTPSIRYVKIYRSDDNKTFEPVSIRPISMQGGLDFVPLLDKTYYYKIAWVDYEYKESPFSAVHKVTPTKIEDDKIFELIQLANVNYFVDHYDVSSGMYMPFRVQGKSIVSTEDTGVALLSMIVGVSRGSLSKNVFLHRVKRIVDFLGTVPTQHGVYASFYDTRTKKPVYRDQRASFSVQATTSIIEALLVTKQFLSGDTNDEKQIREKITQLADKVNWHALLVETTTDALVADIPANERDSVEIRPLGGFNSSMNTYLLAASSKKGFPTSGFLNNLDQRYEYWLVFPDSTHKEGMTDIQIEDAVYDEMEEEDVHPVQDTLWRVDLRKDTVLFGVKLPFGELKTKSLLGLYKPFLTINPYTAKTANYNFSKIVKDYTTYIKRRDNEAGSGTNIHIWGHYASSDTIMNVKINPAISVSSLFIDYDTGFKSLLALYHNYGDQLFTEYGFRAWLNLRDYDVSDEYFAVNQAMVAVMIENARSGLIWKLYSEIPEIKAVQEKIFIK